MAFLLQLLFGNKRNVPISSRSNRVFLAITYFFYFGQLGIFVPYVGLFLDDRGFTSSQIGLLLAIVALSRIVGPNLWANKADKSGKVGEVLRLGCLLAFVTFTLIFVAYDYWILTFTFCCMMMFWTAVLPQLEVITVKATVKTKGGYGKLRLWGSIGFVVCSLIAGLLIDYFGPNIIAIASCAVLFLLYMSSLLIVTPIAKKEHVTNSNVDWKQAFGMVFVIFILSNTLLQVSFGSYYNFFALYMSDLAYTGLQTGVFIAIGVVAEVFVFIFAARLLKKYPVLVLLAFSIIMTGFRWLGLAQFADILWVILICQALHALSFGLTHAASVEFLSKHFSDQFQSRAQALYVSITFGAGSAIGSIIAGYMWQDGAGAALSFGFSAAMAFVAGIILVMLHFHQQTRLGKTT